MMASKDVLVLLFLCYTGVVMNKVYPIDCTVWIRTQKRTSRLILNIYFWNRQRLGKPGPSQRRRLTQECSVFNA
ncbi:unnamed protein product [Acanthoscelides obtectus]|uniref:Secreted protein n=1 Tax=Acanthoscelides obtectus TaxID=200917 RepID=A0A9P0KBG1_ACAOB|nr:unnamed protein product [Acanthoscelides obtectus]CAK1633480.1 hypothetical protein AOBTE_LOCUS8165 [Acanthoscelides obtectus]